MFFYRICRTGMKIWFYAQAIFQGCQSFSALISLNIVRRVCFYLTSHGPNMILFKNYVRIQWYISIQNNSAGIANQKWLQIQTKVQILTLISSKVSTWALFPLKICQKNQEYQKNVASTTTLIIPWPLIIPTEVKIITSFLWFIFEFILATLKNIYSKAHFLKLNQL